MLVIDGWVVRASTGSAPVASLKPGGRRAGGAPRRGIHGVCPRGLIEASGGGTKGDETRRASTGSAPVASLKRKNGMSPRAPSRRRHPRGLPPWPH